MAKLSERTVIVTGAASGIGATCAETFAREGARVVIGDLNDQAGEELANRIAGIFVHTDVSEASSVENLIKEAHAQTHRIDVIMNNAGIDGEQASTGKSSPENWDRVVGVNLNGVYYGMKYALPHMIRQQSGVILNTGSTVGLNGMGGLPAYSASKAGVIHLTRAVAVENARHNIRANSICPSVVQTPLLEHFIENSEDPSAARKTFEELNPMPGMVTREDIANAALFLISDDSKFISGVALPVDGGYTAS